jgi:pimeloyl-ACP methyl ester carboxylesterase
MVDAARAELRTRGVAGAVMLIALSLGGMVALEWAAVWPREVRGCVLVNTSHGGISPPWQRLRPCALAWLLRALLAPTPRGREHAVLRITSNSPPDAQVLQRWTQIAEQRPVRAGNVVRQLVAAASFRAPRRPRAPVLVLVSHGDRLVSPQCSASLALAWQLPLRAHPHAGHDLPLDDPLWVASRIVEWFDGL